MPRPRVARYRAHGVEFGAHLPLIDLGDADWTLGGLQAYAARAAELGYSHLCANDHLLFSRPWLDGPTALAATLDASADLTLATTVALPVVRGPAATAKTLGAIDLLSEGRLVVGVGPGSSAHDYDVVGISFDERWKRFDESIAALRSFWRAGAPSLSGVFYSTEGVALEPAPVRESGPPIWVASWGSRAGIRRAARLGDGWLASGYNTTPARFADGLAYLHEQLRSLDRASQTFPNGISTMWLYITEDAGAAERILTDVLSPMLRRPVEALRELALPIGSPEECAKALARYAEAGAERAFVWPLADELHQLELFQERVAPLVPA